MAVRIIRLFALGIGFAPMEAAALDEEVQHSPAPYAGYEARSIKSLSAGDLAELRRGGGWGLALSAELNGKPGPAHLLELQGKLDLSPNQISETSGIYDDMRVEAIAAGGRFIAAERALSDAFAGAEPGDTRLKDLLDEAAMARAELRFVHLSRHLQTESLLSEAQILKYIVLRGYAQDPCANPPEGHDEAIWRRHNGCDLGQEEK